MRYKIRDLKSGRVIDQTCNAGTKFENVQLITKEMQYLYNDGDSFYFMDNETYEQIPVSADFIGDSNIVDGVMHKDFLVSFSGVDFPCVDRGFAREQSVQVVVRPEDIEVVSPMEGQLTGVVNDVIFKGVHYEMEVTTPDGYEWLVHSTDMFPVGQKVGIHVDPFDIQIMNKPESEDEEAVGVNE